MAASPSFSLFVPILTGALSQGSPASLLALLPQAGVLPGSRPGGWHTRPRARLSPHPSQDLFQRGSKQLQHVHWPMALPLVSPALTLPQLPACLRRPPSLSPGRMSRPPGPHLLASGSACRPAVVWSAWVWSGTHPPPPKLHREGHGAASPALRVLRLNQDDSISWSCPEVHGVLVQKALGTEPGIQ